MSNNPTEFTSQQPPVYTEKEMREALYAIVSPLWDLLDDKYKQQLGPKAIWVAQYYNQHVKKQ